MFEALLNMSLATIAIMAVVFVLPLKMTASFCGAQAGGWGRCCLSTVLAMLLGGLVTKLPGLGALVVPLALGCMLGTHMAVLKVPGRQWFSFLVMGFVLHLATWFAIYSALKHELRAPVQAAVTAPVDSRGR